MEYAVSLIVSLCECRWLELLIAVALNSLCSTASVVSHVPWAAQTLQRIPYIRRDLQSLRKFAVDTATRRLQAGASTKDLWYYLVRSALTYQ